MDLWIILATFVVSTLSSPPTSKQYRLDYEYNEKTDAFYKLHTEGETKFTAITKCNEEGAELAMLTSDEDLRQIHTMMKKFPDVRRVIIISDRVENNSVESDGYCNVLNHLGVVETVNAYGKRAFACKVAAKDAPYSDDCHVYANGYESRISTTGSCYKVSTGEATWDEASADCQAEGAHLVILNNAEELEVVNNLLQDKPRYYQMQYYAGVRAAAYSKEPRVFKTVFNQTLEEVGYRPWVEGEPNEGYTGGNCVALDVRHRAQYCNIHCWFKMKYVCESDVNSKMT